MAIGPAPSASADALGVDERSLDALRRQATRDPRAAIRAAAQQFEAVFMETVMKSMREATQQAFGGSGAGGAGEGTATFTTMLDTQFARTFAGRPGGLAQMLEQQLTRQLGALPPATDGAARAATLPAGASGAAARQAPTDVQAPVDADARRAFVGAMLPHALKAQQRTGVPAAYIVGQAALESGWGAHEIRGEGGARSHNLFGIKATGSWQGGATEALTTEYEQGAPTARRERFRSYGSHDEAFADYARLVSLPRYVGALAPGSTPEQFAAAMQRSGYATDPQYAAKLARTIRQAMSLQAPADAKFAAAPAAPAAPATRSAA